MSIAITSNNKLSNIEQHFKVLAGPGAGKTSFLVNHIKNILNNSERLKIQRKIACITYTNVAAENILKRVGEHAGKLEISTIHNFLYKYLVKPYVHLIAEEFELDAVSVDGHDETIFSGYNFISEWKTKIGKKYLDEKEVAKCWDTLRWKLDDNDNITLNWTYHIAKYINSNDNFEYKKMAWSRGVLHHDDILFFSYQLVNKYPFTLNILRASFPYFLIDEFQDTSPIQVYLLKLIAQKETIVGIVGDEAQSIYKFLGVKDEQLQSFELTNMANYTIKDNWRSSNQIIELLNELRPSLVQSPLRNFDSTKVHVFVGNKLSALRKAHELFPDTDITTLCRENITANELKKGINLSTHGDYLSMLKKIDTNSERRRTISNAIKAIEYAKMGYYKDAWKMIGKLHNRNKSLDDKKKSIRSLKLLLDNESDFSEKPIMTLFDFLNGNDIAQLPKFKAGKPKDFYDSTFFQDIAMAVKNLYEAGNHRTIHKSKGDEFETVMVVLDTEKDGSFNAQNKIKFLNHPNLAKNEEHRVMYVALSRAKNHLIINCPNLCEESSKLLLSKGFQIVSTT